MGGRDTLTGHYRALVAAHELRGSGISAFARAMEAVANGALPPDLPQGALAPSWAARPWTPPSG